MVFIVRYVSSIMRALVVRCIQHGVSTMPVASISVLSAVTVVMSRYEKRAHIACSTVAPWCIISTYIHACECTTLCEWLSKSHSQETIDSVYIALRCIPIALIQLVETRRNCSLVKQSYGYQMYCPDGWHMRPSTTQHLPCSCCVCIYSVV